MQDAGAIGDAGAGVEAEVLRIFGRGTCLARVLPGDEHVLVHGAIAGERVRLRRLDRPGARRFVVEEVLRPSPDRVKPGCPVAERCAGCAHLHVSREREVEDKRRLVQEVLARFAGVEWPLEQVIGLAPAVRTHLRTRASWTLQRSGDGGVSATFRALDGPPVEARGCPAVVPGLRDALGELLSICNGLVGEFETAVSLAMVGDRPVLTVVAEDPVWPEAGDAAVLARGFAAVAERAGRRTRCRSGRWPMAEGLAEAPAVWQHSTVVGEELVRRWVRGLALDPIDGLLDATCGAGGTLELLGGGCGRVVAIDRHHAALMWCRERCARLGWDHVVFRGGRLETLAPRLAGEGEAFDAVVVNPMRRSLGAATMAQLGALGHKDFLYLAPAPRAGAEDIGVLVAGGWRVAAVAALDLQPATASVMMAVHLRRDVAGTA